MSRRPNMGSGAKEGVRWIVVSLFVAALIVATAVDMPTKGSGATASLDLPDVALGQASIYRIEIFLFAFYGGLLIATPLFRGVAGGHLPIEISARGAKFAEEAADSIDETQKLVADLRQRLVTAEATAVRTRLNIDQLAEETSTSLRD
jgi:hypothetical protein